VLTVYKNDGTSNDLKGLIKKLVCLLLSLKILKLIIQIASWVVNIFKE